MSFNDARPKAHQIIAGIGGGRKAATVGSVSRLMCYPLLCGICSLKSAPEFGIMANRRSVDALRHAECAEVGVDKRRPVVGGETNMRAFRKHLTRSTGTGCERRCYRAELIPTTVV